MRLSGLFAGTSSTPYGLANFDSATTLVRAAASYLSGEDFPALGMMHPAAIPVVRHLNALPRRVRAELFMRSGASEGIAPDELGSIDVEAFSRWVVDRYPSRGYPAVMIGSSNGAAAYLAALLGIPWLPQTFLVPVRRSLAPDAIREDLRWGATHADPLLDANPTITLAQMHDPNQDRLMVRKVAYFRIKRTRLGRAYRSFLETVLEPGGTIVLVECDLTWPAVELSDRHTYQVGGLGGLSPEEYYSGSDRVEAFLADRGLSIDRWDSPTPDGEYPEAEWGFDPRLREAVRRYADRRGYRIRRLSFEEPSALSPFVSDRYRARYDDRDRPTDRLFAQSFALVEPWWTIRTGSVPFWLPFNSRDDARHLERYLSASRPYNEIWTNHFSHGVESAGYAPADRWRMIHERARRCGGFVGVDPAAYPVDLEVAVRYHEAIPATFEDRYPHFPPMPFDRFDGIATEASDRYPFRWRSG